jgi:hypothetical protein
MLLSIIQRYAKIVLPFLLLLTLAVLVTISSGIVVAGTGSSAGGWAWSGSESVDDGVINGNESGIGWISMNSLDCDTDENSQIDVAACGSVGSPIANYGVNIPSVDGVLTGYAWSEHLGWISFNAADVVGCENLSVPTPGPSRVGDLFQGAARILSVRDAGSYTNGYDGCISLSGPGYGVVVEPSGSDLDGFAWSSDFGWIDMSNVTFVPAPVDPILLGYGCQIPVNGNTCDGRFTWDALGASGPVQLYNERTGQTYSTNSSGVDEYHELQPGNNLIQLLEGIDILKSITVGATCDSGSDWDPVSMACVSLPSPPNITIEATPKLIRRGQQADIDLRISANYDLMCTLYGANIPPDTFTHFASPLEVSHSFTTRPLTSNQVIQVNCIATGVVSTESTIIEVLPSLQEV